MQIKHWIAVLFLASSTLCFADDQQEITQGAGEYDWQTCVSDKTSDCVNNCSNSEDVDCSDNCPSLASDKCQSQGLSPPSQ